MLSFVKKANWKVNFQEGIQFQSRGKTLKGQSLWTPNLELSMVFNLLHYGASQKNLPQSSQ
jgi:hypothetical protein